MISEIGLAVLTIVFCFTVVITLGIIAERNLKRLQKMERGEKWK